MEALSFKRLKKIAGNLVEEKFTKTGRVLAVRLWQHNCMAEIDLHLPGINMEEWSAVPYIKFSVGDFAYRDYTPFGWDAETHTCSLLIDTAHKGAGSNWAVQLQPGDQVYYMPVASTRQAPQANHNIVALGDSSSVAHLLALRQLTQPINRFSGAVILQNGTQEHSLTDYFRSAVNPVSSFAALQQWIERQSFSLSETWFYLTGNNRLVGDLRRQLKGAGYRHFDVKGFWD